MSEWVEQTTGVFKYNGAPTPKKETIGSNELLAYCISLGADLRELDENLSGTYVDLTKVKALLTEIIDQHNFVFHDVKL